MQQAQALVILFTGDDETRLGNEFATLSDSNRESEFASQPRPNVIFESGLALGKYPGCTILVQIGSPRLFSDIAGIHYIRLDNSLKARQELAQRLVLAGCPADLSGTDWHDAGNFE
jgi:predicted nucleotide-binding protein